MGRYPIDSVLRIVRTAPTAAAGWKRVRSLCQRHWPSPLWSRIRGVDPSGDVAAATAWLRAQLAAATARHQVRGIYLGLDTLNMDSPDGTNVEIGATPAWRPGTLDIEWVYELPWYGVSHLIAGLRAMHEEYARPEWSRLFDAADYILFLGYSGAVLSEAAARIRWPRRMLVVWGFHDGDLFVLGRGERGGFQRLAAIV